MIKTTNIKYKLVKIVCSYRVPLLVTKIKLYLGWQLSFPVCPKCKMTLEREYQNYCDRCGQCLDWSKFDDAEIIVIKK